MPEKPSQELLVALAGPAVNVVLALVLYAVLALRGSFVPPWAAEHTGANILEKLLWINVSLALFNLLPAFPMDGGRILRALLGWRGGWLRATERAVWIGRWLALSLCFFGLGLCLLGETGPLTLVLVGVFIWWSGNQELASVRARHAFAPARSGFSPAEIASLERFRGRISDRPPEPR